MHWRVRVLSGTYGQVRRLLTSRASSARRSRGRFICSRPCLISGSSGNSSASRQETERASQIVDVERHFLRHRMLHQFLQHLDQARVFSARRLVAFVGQELDRSHQQVIARLGCIQDPELRTAARDDAEHAVVQRVEVDDRAVGADTEYFGLRGPFADARIRTFANQHDAEAGLFAQAAADHRDVARFEDPQRQAPTAEQHGSEREERNFLTS